MNLKAGSQLQGGRYRIEKVLGQGGFGITYLGVQTSLDDKVAIKEFFMKELCNRDAGTSNVSVGSVGSRELVDGFRKKFTKEARNIRKLKHHNIVSIIDVFEENGTAYYVMEYFEGGNLKELVEKHGPLDEETAVVYIRQLANALDKVHRNGLLHLDVKPANVMLNNSGEAVLIDFGISKHYDEDGAQTSSGLIGTSEGYAPLEQYEAASLKTFTAATDVYALGATLFFLLTGVRPPKASDVMNVGLPELPVNVSPEVKRAIVAAMQPAVRMRPQSVAEFMALLDNADKTEIVTDDVTVIDVPITPNVKPDVTTQGQKIKWMDFMQFCDNVSISFSRMRFCSIVRRVALISWIVALSNWLLAVIILPCLKPGTSTHEFWNVFTFVVFVTSIIIAVICNIITLFYRSLNVIGLRDIQDTSSRIKMIRSRKGRLGLAELKGKKLKSRLKMQYSKITRVSDEMFICERRGRYGVYNAAKRKVIVPVNYENLKFDGNRFVATKGGAVTVFTDKGYRVVE